MNTPTQRMCAILEEQRAVVEQLVAVTSDLLDSPAEPDIEQLEQLVKYRAEQIRIIAALESERRELGQELIGNNIDLSRKREKIRTKLDLLARHDHNLTEMMRRARLQIINNMAFIPEYINFRGKTAAGHQIGRPAVDLIG